MTTLTQSVKSKDKVPEGQLGRSPHWFKALLLLTTFTLGGLVATELTQRLLQDIADRLITVEAQAEILNVLDHFLPYRIGYVGATFLLTSVTVGGYLWLRTKSPLAISLALAIPIVALLYLWVLRAPLAAPVGAISPTPTAVSTFPTPATAAAPAPTPLSSGDADTYHNAVVGYDVDYLDGRPIDAGNKASGTVVLWSQKVDGPGADDVPAKN